MAEITAVKQNTAIPPAVEYPENVMEAIMRRFDYTTASKYASRAALSATAIAFAPMLSEIYAPDQFDDWYQHKKSADFYTSFTHTLHASKLTDQELAVVSQHFMQGFTCTELSNQMGLTRARIYQIIDHVVAKLTWPDKFVVLYFGEEYVKSKAALVDDSYTVIKSGTPPSEISIDSMGLTVRSYNHLRRAGLLTAEAIINAGMEKLKSIPGIGSRSIEDITNAMWGVGYNLVGNQFVRDDTPYTPLRITNETNVFTSSTVMETLDGLDNARMCVVSMVGQGQARGLSETMKALRTASAAMKKLMCLSRVDFDYPRSLAEGCENVEKTALFFSDELSPEAVRGILKTKNQGDCKNLVITSRDAADAFLSAVRTSVEANNS